MMTTILVTRSCWYDKICKKKTVSRDQTDNLQGRNTQLVVMYFGVSFDQISYKQPTLWWQDCWMDQGISSTPTFLVAHLRFEFIT